MTWSVVSVLAFAVSWWLGLYLLSRGPRKPELRRAGAGLLGYALALVVDAMLGHVDETASARFVLVCLPAVVWSGVFVRFFGERTKLAERVWRRVLWPVVLVSACAILAGVEAARFALAAVAAVALLVGLVGALLDHSPLREPAVRAAGVPGLLVVGSLLLGLGLVLPLTGLELLPRELSLPLAGLDLVLLGIGIALADAFDEGQALKTDMLRSFVTAAAAAGVFGGQAAVALALTGTRPVLVALLYGTVAAAVALQTLATPLHTAVDRIVLRSRPAVRQSREELRDAADALARQAPDTALAALDEREFTRLTRRALSHYGDLGKLVSSPLVSLPAVRRRLTETNAPDSPLGRAAVLKALLAESIARLKPATGEDFGTSEEWRHYNALYFYYVAGIRPYSVRTKRTDLDPVARRALAWFVDQVPERTLYNWQNAAAKIVAAELRAELSPPVQPL